MTADELESRIIAIKKRGLNFMIEQELIRELRSDYFRAKMNAKMTGISNQFHRNLEFLSRVYTDQINSRKTREFMGIEINSEDEKIFYEKKKIYSLRLALIASEYYGIPVEHLLFKELSADERLFKQQYPTLIRQNRD